MNKFAANRNFMRANFHELDDIKTDQQQCLPQPPLQKEFDSDAKLIELPEVNKETLAKNDFFECLKERKSVRKYAEDSLSLEELSFLLWATQGVKEIVRNGYATLRPVPSGGARHPFETYLVVNRVEGLEKGVYRYIPLEHKLLFMFPEENLPQIVSDINQGQIFVGKGAVVFMWSCVPYRGEWRYNVSAHKTMLLDAGHLCQNLYLACEAINCGTCAIGAYDQKMADEFLGLDGEEEFVVYIAPVGKK